MKEQGKHTPGPWEATCACNWFSVSEATGDQRRICRTDTPEGETPISYDEQDANTSLMAAAPELLEVCEMARLFVSGDSCMVVQEVLDQLDAGINKAEGR